MLYTRTCEYHPGIKCEHCDRDVLFVQQLLEMHGPHYVHEFRSTCDEVFTQTGSENTLTIFTISLRPAYKSFALDAAVVIPGFEAIHFRVPRRLCVSTRRRLGSGEVQNWRTFQKLCLPLLHAHRCWDVQPLPSEAEVGLG